MGEVVLRAVKTGKVDLRLSLHGNSPGRKMRGRWKRAGNGAGSWRDCNPDVWNIKQQPRRYRSCDQIPQLLTPPKKQSDAQAMRAAGVCVQTLAGGSDRPL